ncbi:hypothetical protein [Pseudomonas phage PP21]
MFAKKGMIRVRVVAADMCSYVVQYHDSSKSNRGWCWAFDAMFKCKEAAMYHAYQWLGKMLKEKKHREQGVVYSIDESQYHGEVYPGLYEKELIEAKELFLDSIRQKRALEIAR